MTLIRRTLKKPPDGRSQVIPAMWAGIVAVSLLLSGSIVADPTIGTIVLLSVFVLAAALFRLDAAIQAAIVILFFFYRFEIQHLGLHKKYADVFVTSAFPVAIVYLLWWLRRGAGIDHWNGRNYVNSLILVLIVWGGISYLWTKDVIHGLVLTVNTILGMMIVQLLTVAISSHAAMRRTLVFLIALGCALGVYTIATKYYKNSETKYQIEQNVKFVIQSGGEGLGNFKVTRANGFAKSDVAGFGLNLFVFVALACFIGGHGGIKRPLAFLALFYLLMCLVLTGSKGALGGLLLGLPVAIFANPVLRGRKINWMIGMVLLLASAFVFNFVVFQEGRIAKSVSGGSSTKIAVASFSTRQELWKIGFEEFLTTYGLGLGNGTSAGLAEKKALPHMHSFFFSALFDLGIAGFAVYMAIIAKIGMRLNDMRKYGAGPFERSLACCLAGSLAAAMFQGALISEYANLLFWVILGLIVAVTSLPLAQRRDGSGLPLNREPLQAAGGTA